MEHPIIQLAAVAMDENGMIESFEVKVQFDPAMADAQALAVNHYDPDIWQREAITPAVARAKFTTFLKRFCDIEHISKRTGRPYRVAQLAGHNVASFDMPRLQKWYQDANEFLVADPRPLDTLQFAMWYFHVRGKRLPSYRLTEICKHFGIGVENAHDALADVMLCAEFIQRLTSKGR